MKTSTTLLNSMASALIGICLLASCSGKSPDSSGKTDTPHTDTIPAGGKIDKPLIAEPKAKFDTVQDGDFVMRYPNGVIQIRGYYRNGKREGDWASFFPSGKIQSEGFFTAGKRDHKGIVYYDNGEKMYEGMYKDGLQVGVWKFYDRKGKLTNEIDYDKQK
jgi:hypothetical protein